MLDFRAEINHFFVNRKNQQAYNLCGNRYFHIFYEVAQFFVLSMSKWTFTGFDCFFLLLAQFRARYCDQLIGSST